MMVVEETGRTPEAAVQAGLRKLGLPREYVLVETLSVGSEGFLGFGARAARVRLTVTPGGERLIRARETLEEIVARMGVEATVRCEERAAMVHLEVSGEHAGLLIGKQGQTLEALQLLVARILSHRLGERAPVEVDIEGYRERRRRQIEQMALRLARQVKATGEPVLLDSLGSAERRIIHLALQGDTEVRTSSIGAGSGRSLRIAPAGPSSPV
jgi:spoIIIJ-associated protein